MADDFNQPEEDDIPTAPFWMATFSDMATLLLTFFVLIAAMSEVKVNHFMEALSYFQGRTGVMQFENVIPSAEVQTVAKPKSDEVEGAMEDKRERAERFEQLMAFLTESELADKVEASMTDRGVQVIITDSVMFASGKAELLTPSRRILQSISRVVDEQVKAIVVEGHTDNIPIRNSIYPSNWELSAARAAAVVRFLLEQQDTIAPAHYFPMGFGEHHPLGPNDTAAGRARNRRVEILFSREPWPSKNSLSKMEVPTP